MYCPECGEDADDAKFCPECGTDLRGLAEEPVCTDCGAELPGGARYCPECGAAQGAADDADAADPAAPEPGASGGRRTGTRGRGGGTSRAGRRRQEPPRRTRPTEPAPAAAAAGPGRLSPAVVWGGFGLLAVVVVLVVVLLANGGAEQPGAAAPAAALSATPVSADTSGGYAQLVDRANGLYDRGAAEFESEHWDQGAAYFAAAAEVYAAAWKKQATDPNVGTDYATSLFYSGEIDKAVAQVEKVLSQSPDFQTGWFNKGNYLTERGRQAQQDGDAEAAEAAYDDARAAFEKAVSLGAGTASGQQAQLRLDELPQ